MQLVEKHVIKQTDPRFVLIDRAAFASKNLYNAALYEIRQHFIFQGKRLKYNQLDKIMQKQEAYRMLPTKVSQQVLMLLDKNVQSYFSALQAWKKRSFSVLRPSKVTWIQGQERREERTCLYYPGNIEDFASSWDR